VGQQAGPGHAWWPSIAFVALCFAGLQLHCEEFTLARSCKICTNPERKEIEAAINSGATGVAIAKRFGLTTVNVSRHKTGHMAPLQRIKARRQPQNGHPTSSVERLEVMYADARSLLDDALAHGQTQTSFQAIKELRGVVELLAKLKGEWSDRPAVQVNLLASPDFQRVQTVILRALEPHPDARADVATALMELEAPR
jgi:hypothetical protein